MSLEPGTRLGPYDLQSRLDRTVAIKVLPAELASDPERRERFESS